MADVIVHYQSVVPKSYPPQGQPKSFSDEFLVIFLKFYFRSQVVRLHLNLNKTSRKKNTVHTPTEHSHCNQEDWFLLEIYASGFSRGLDQFAIIQYFISK